MRRQEAFLYQLLPEYIRFRDQEDGQALEALMGTLETEYQRLYQGMQRLYEDWFIETCQPWLVPFIGNLVGLERLDRHPQTEFTWRPLVAKAVARRRYKGTVTSLERSVRDATGWATYARSLAESTGWSQDVRATIPGVGGLVNLRDAASLDKIGTPFQALSQTVDVRSAVGTERLVGSSLFNLPEICVHIWRVDARPIWRGEPREVGPGCYTFDPFGQDIPLYIQPDSPTGERAPVTELELPVPLRTETLGRLLDEVRDHEMAGQVGQSPIRRWLEIYDVDQGQAIPLRSIAAWDLSSWRRPGPADRFCLDDKRVGHGVWHQIEAAIDPELGRLALAQTPPPPPTGEGSPEKAREGRVLVSYSYGTACHIGGGPYRQERWNRPTDTWYALVMADHHRSSEGDAEETVSPDFDEAPIFPTLEKALAAWPKDEAKARLKILGSGQMVAPKGVWNLDLRERRELILEASEGSRPFLRGHLLSTGAAVARQVNSIDPNQPLLRLAGLWLDGSVVLRGSVILEIEESTIGPPLRQPLGRPAQETPTLRERGALCAREPLLALILIQSSIIGPIRLPASGVGLEMKDSVVDAGLWRRQNSADVIAISDADSGPGPNMRVLRSTLLGEVRATSIEALDTYFCRRPMIQRTGLGFLKHAFVPPGDSVLPPQSHCLPPESPNPCAQAPGWAGAEESENWLVSRAYGDPGYAQLKSSAPRPLMSGGTNGSSIGVLHRLYEADRLERLPAIFEETLRSGTEAEVLLVDGGAERRGQTRKKLIRNGKNPS